MNGSEALIQFLVKANVIPQGYTGQVVLHIGQGGLCDVERREDRPNIRLKERLSGMDQKIFLDILKKPCNNLANNANAF